LFERAGIGQKDTDNGLLIVVSLREHAVRIEVGYGLESIVTDGFAGEIIREQMTPEFRAGRYGPGLVAGTARIIDRIAEVRGFSIDTPQPAVPNERLSMTLGVILFFAICGLVLGAILLAIWILARKTGGIRSTPLEGGPLGSGQGATPTRSHGSHANEDDSRSSSSSGFDGFGGGSSGGGGASGSW